MADRRATRATPDGWPECDSEQVRVLLLGTYHMANPGNDEVNVEADDVLTPKRQSELAALTDRLAEWNPDRIALERPYDSADAVNSLYRAYRSDDQSYDEPDADPSNDLPGDVNVDSRSETVQVGFRLANRLGHDRVAAIDERPDEPDADPFEERKIDSTRKTAVGVPDSETIQRETEERLASSTISEFLAWVNRESYLRKGHAVMFDRGVRAADERFGSPVALAHWYDRNIRMVHHLWRAVEEGDERVLLVVGSGHVRALRHLLEEAPMFCPVSPLPYLP